MDEWDVFEIQVGAAYRSDDLVDAISDPDAPRILRQLPTESLVELLEVWIWREVLKAERAKVTAAGIARLIVQMGWRNASANFAALSTRVSRDLARIERFEKLPWRGWVLLPPFDPQLEFSS
ncbi:MAG: hypothetical protein H0W74_10925 [Sphingosinicella sp.]|nr:hypothetical protein [Sphingosinicella sp.]